MTVNAPDLFQICDEFQRSRSTPFPSGFYGLPGFPSSGPFSLAQCVGLSNVSFTPDGGNVSSTVVAPANAVVSINCNQSATWTFSLPAGVTSTVASGSAANTIQFTLSQIATRSFSVNGSALGMSRDFTVTLVKENNN